VFDDPHVQARQLKIEMPHPTAGTMPLVGSPIRMSATPVEYRLPPPLLGQHTLSVLEEVLGLSRAEIDALAENKIVQAQGLS
jgi:crotonobetainyl-CoA:carnitine CoA-transferase CaiB-like acyl-CoA transferase